MKGGSRKERVAIEVLDRSKCQLLSFELLAGRETWYSLRHHLDVIVIEELM